MCHIAKMRFGDNGKDTGNDWGPDNQRRKEKILLTETAEAQATTIMNVSGCLYYNIFY